MCWLNFFVSVNGYDCVFLIFFNMVLFLGEIDIDLNGFMFVLLVLFLGNKLIGVLVSVFSILKICLNIFLRLWCFILNLSIL